MTAAGERVRDADEAMARIDDAIENYRQAVEAATLSSWPSTKPIAQLALGLGYRLQGQAFDHQGDFAQAQQSLQLAAETLTEALPPLEAMEQLQSVGLAYLSMGTVQHTLGSVYARSEQPEASQSAFQEALNFYRRCIRLGNDPGADPFLRTQIIECGCKPYEQAVEDSLIQLGGGSG